MTGAGLPLHSHHEVVSAFNVELDYALKTRFNAFDIRGAMMAVANEPYTRVMLSPRLPLFERYGTYTTTDALISDQKVREDLMLGVGFAVKTMGPLWVSNTVQCLGLVFSFFFMAEVYQQLKVTLYERSVKAAPKTTVQTYDLQETYLAALAANIELCFPEEVSLDMIGRIFWAMRLKTEQVRAIRERVNLITGHLSINYSVH
ncbi:hypothetical protein D3C81_193410 [compost metagenome]|jgi:hypothetical protein